MTWKDPVDLMWDSMLERVETMCQQIEEEDPDKVIADGLALLEDMKEGRYSWKSRYEVLNTMARCEAIKAGYPFTRINPSTMVLNDFMRFVQDIHRN